MENKLIAIIANKMLIGYFLRKENIESLFISSL